MNHRAAKCPSPGEEGGWEGRGKTSPSPRGTIKKVFSKNYGGNSERLKGVLIANEGEEKPGCHLKRTSNESGWDSLTLAEPLAFSAAAGFVSLIAWLSLSALVILVVTCWWHFKGAPASGTSN